MSNKFFDMVASWILLFDVDWNADFADDEYCLENRQPVITAAKPSRKVAVARRAG